MEALEAKKNIRITENEFVRFFAQLNRNYIHDLAVSRLVDNGFQIIMYDSL